jgi:hypothetical protein
MLISKRRGRFQGEPAILRVAGSPWNPTEGSPYLNKCVNTVLTQNFELIRNI